MYKRQKLYLVLLAAFIVLNFVLGDRDEPRVKTPVMEQLRAVWSDARLWFLSLFYFEMCIRDRGRPGGRRISRK